MQRDDGKIRGIAPATGPEPSREKRRVEEEVETGGFNAVRENDRTGELEECQVMVELGWIVARV